MAPILVSITSSDLELIREVMIVESSKIVTLEINNNFFLDLDKLIDRGYPREKDLTLLKEEERAQRRSALVDKRLKKKREGAFKLNNRGGPSIEDREEGDLL